MEISLYNLWKQQGGEYPKAVELYNLYGKSSVLKSLFARGLTPYNFEKIEQELLSITIKLPTQTAQQASLPAPIAIEQKKLGNLIGQMSHLHAKLEEVQTDKERCELAAQIVEMADTRRSIFNRIDTYKSTGNDLTPSQKTIETPKEINPFKELALLRSQRSKLKNKPNRVADYNKVVERISELENQLKNEE